MKQEGMQITCDNCGTKTFIFRTDDLVMDGGYTKASRYEAMPTGWEVLYLWSHYLDLCPDCIKKLKWLIRDKTPNIAKIVFEEEIADGNT